MNPQQFKAVIAHLRDYQALLRSLGRKDSEYGMSALAMTIAQLERESEEQNGKV